MHARPAAQWPGVFALAVLSLASLLMRAEPLLAQAPSEDRIARIKTLFDEQRWAEVVDAVGAVSADSADLNYYYGSAAAQLGQWERARAAFLAGIRVAPADARFPVELGGVAYREGRYDEAADWLHRGLRLAPGDSYANNFLATIYFLNGNLEAALRYWNRIGQPRIESIRPGMLRVKPELLDRAFAFAPAEVLRLPDLLTTETRLDGLGIFASRDFQLALRNDGSFDVDLRARERNGMGNGTLQAVASTFRGILWSTAYPEYYNIRRSAINARSLVRWDSQKRRLFASLSGPLRRNPKYRLQVGADLRNDNWDVREPSSAGIRLDALNLRREAAEISFTSFEIGRWTWATGAEFSRRDYRNVLATPALAQQALLSGYQLKHFAQLDYGLLRMPERRITTTVRLSAQTGTIWSTPRHAFEKLQAGILTRWLPELTGEDYATELQVRYGRTLGDVPFDELYVLGLEGDTPLGMRAHRGTRDGRKGNAPMGRNYFLTNLESDKIVYERGLIGIALRPFLDVGKVTDPVAELGSRRWLFDTGVQVKFLVWGIGFTMTYGKNLRTGKDALYLSGAR